MKGALCLHSSAFLLKVELAVLPRRGWEDPYHQKPTIKEQPEIPACQALLLRLLWLPVSAARITYTGTRRAASHSLIDRKGSSTPEAPLRHALLHMALTNCMEFLASRMSISPEAGQPP
jgi:hypothetical protein